MIRVAQIAPVWRVKAGMSNRELQKAARLQHAIAFGKGAVSFRNIHQTHKRCRKIKSGIGERQINSARHTVIDVQLRFLFRFPRVSNKNLGDVDCGHPCAALREQTGVVAFAAADVETSQSLDLRQHREKRRGVEVVAIYVITGPRQFRPRLSARIPISAGLVVIHRF
jgi:hypothetical protein